MITESDNDDAQIVFDTVGQGALRALAHRVGMTHFATSPIWGETEITAADQTKFFLHIDSYIVARHRAYAMSLLAGIVPVASAGASARSRRRAGSSTSRAAGDTAPACSTTRWRCSYGAARACRSRC